jgi:arginyl-tRNA synthetase
MSFFQTVIYNNIRFEAVMTHIANYLTQQLKNAFHSLGYSTEKVVAIPSSHAADYQCNTVLSLAKQLKQNPLPLSQKIASVLQQNQDDFTVEIAGGGFINLTLSDHFLEKIAFQLFNDDRLGIPLPKQHMRILIDSGGANIAKEMHVGHLRSAIIGESIRRLCQFVGDEVTSDVHLGDWGTHIGMLIVQFEIENPGCFQSESTLRSCYHLSINDLSNLYKRSALNFKNDLEFKDKARLATFALQQHHITYKLFWELLREISIADIKKIYSALDTHFELWWGESDVNDIIPNMIVDLKNRGLLTESEGAQVMFLTQHDQTLPPRTPPLIIQKKDGAYTYATTDLATIYKRMQMLNPQVILYVVDQRQSQHFQQVFTAARLAGYVNDQVKLEHISLGTVNGPDGKPFKTREGKAIKLNDLLVLSKQKTLENSLGSTSAEQNKNDLDETMINQIAIAAIKYQDLKNNRLSDYIFDLEHFTQFEGKTGPYLQYGVVRVNSMMAKLKEMNYTFTPEIKIFTPIARELLLMICRFAEAVELAYIKREPSIISEFAYNLTKQFSTFYDQCNVINEPNLQIRNTKITLVLLFSKVLTQCLYFLGISVPEKMIRK